MTEDIIEIGDTVLCDLCNTDYTDSDESGGLIVGSNAVCPRCEGRIRENLRKHGEEREIKAECPEGMSFKAFVLTYRNGNNAIRIYFAE